MTQRCGVIVFFAAQNEDKTRTNAISNQRSGSSTGTAEVVMGVENDVPLTNFVAEKATALGTWQNLVLQSMPSVAQGVHMAVPRRAKLML